MTAAKLYTALACIMLAATPAAASTSLSIGLTFEDGLTRWLADDMLIVGIRITNNSGIPLKWVHAECIGFDSANALVSIGTGRVGDLNPGDHAFDEVLFDNFRSPIKSYSCTITEAWDGETLR